VADEIAAFPVSAALWTIPETVEVVAWTTSETVAVAAWVASTTVSLPAVRMLETTAEAA